MMRIGFCVTFIVLQMFTSGFKPNSWLDDIDGPTFLRGAEQKAKEKNELDSTDDSPNDLSGVARDDVVTTIPSQHESMICEVVANSKGITTSSWDSNTPPEVVHPGHPMHRYCGPHPAVVLLDKAPGVRLIPDAVTLNRCVGGCVTSQLIRNCTVTAQKEIAISVIEMIGEKQQSKTITLYDHSECACDCIKRKSDCNQDTQNYDADTCSCTCKENESSCNSATQSWDSRDCQCKCKTVKLCDDLTVKHEWNDKTCDCECKQKFKNRCLRKGKVLNKANCECECPTPLPACPTGTSFLKYNCTCV